jgi:diguanylate cyclase (GGDEF)-like protein
MAVTVIFPDAFPPLCWFSLPFFMGRSARQTPMSQDPKNALNSSFRRDLHHYIGRSQIAIALITLTVIVAIWLIALSRAEVDGQRSLDEEIKKNDNLVLLHEERMVRSIELLDQLVLSLRDSCTLHGPPKDLDARLMAMNTKRQYIDVVSLLDENGRVMTSTNKNLFDQDYSDREYFRAHRSDPADVIQIGRPVLGRATHKWILPITRRLIKKDGSFGGTIFLGVNPAFFAGYYEGAKESNTTTSLVGLDGYTRARRTGENLFFGDDLRKSPLLVAAKQAPSGSYSGVALSDGGRIRLVSYRVLKDFPMIAVSSSSMSEVTAAIEYRKSLYSFFALFGSVLLLITGGSLIRSTARAQMDRLEIERLAYYDALTSLPNRRLLMDRLRKSKEEQLKTKSLGALLFIDLDDFKSINDTMGHHVGDQLLNMVAKRILSCARPSDTCARLGGDEFIIMLHDLGQDMAHACAQAQHIATQLSNSLNVPHMLEGENHTSTASIGITMLEPDPRENINDPLKRADMAMYQAKNSGRNRVKFFDPRIQEMVATRSAMESDIRIALAEKQFVLHYQPQIQGKDKAIGAEALVRWIHPTKGLIPPAQFIPLAEETGLIMELGTWVLEEACRQLKIWEDQEDNPHLANLTLAVNVSAQQFLTPDFAEQVKRALEKSGAWATKLKLELTEGMLINDVEDVIAKMESIKRLGVSFSLDDFGTGYSSLSYLKRLPMDQIKIDQGFVRDVLVDSNDAAIAKMVIMLSENLGLNVIAEGVETEAHRRWLAEQGCECCQGYLFSKPLAVEAFERYVQTLMAGKQASSVRY